MGFSKYFQSSLRGHLHLGGGRGPSACSHQGHGHSRPGMELTLSTSLVADGNETHTQTLSHTQTCRHIHTLTHTYAHHSLSLFLFLSFFLSFFLSLSLTHTHTQTHTSLQSVPCKKVFQVPFTVHFLFMFTITLLSCWMKNE